MSRASAGFLVLAKETSRLRCGRSVVGFVRFEEFVGFELMNFESDDSDDSLESDDTFFATVFFPIAPMPRYLLG